MGSLGSEARVRESNILGHEDHGRSDPQLILADVERITTDSATPDQHVLGVLRVFVG
jgi:hypothetical protein